MSETRVIHVREMVEGDIYIGRRNNRYRLKETIWANPSGLTEKMDINVRVQNIRSYELGIRSKLRHYPELYDIETLRGKRLACWCHPLPCHGDVLVKILAEREIANV